MFGSRLRLRLGSIVDEAAEPVPAADLADRAVFAAAGPESGD